MPPPEPQNEHDPALAPSTAELDLLESGRPRLAGRSQPRVRPPQVELGKLTEQGIAPAIMAIVERGVRRRPALARDMSAEIELVLEERYPPVRIVFGDRVVLVEDGSAVAPDLRVRGSLPDLVSLMVAPLLGGLPSPINPRGRAALGMVALGRVRIDGRLGMMRRFLSLIRV